MAIVVITTLYCRKILFTIRILTRIEIHLLACDLVHCGFNELFIQIALKPSTNNILDPLILGSNLIFVLQLQSTNSILYSVGSYYYHCYLRRIHWYVLHFTWYKCAVGRFELYVLHYSNISLLIYLKINMLLTYYVFLQHKLVLNKKERI